MAASVQGADRRSAGTRYAGVPLAVLAGTLVVTLLLDRQESFEPPWLLPLLNGVFLTGIPGLIAYLAVRAYVATGVPSVLAIGTGMVATSVGCGVVPGLLIALAGPNAGVTVHNIGALVAGAALVAAVLAGPTRVPAWNRRLYMVLAAYGVTALGMLLVIALAMASRTPAFLVPGVGMTPLREVVLGTAAAAFAYAGLTWWQVWQRNRDMTFLRWYALALGLFALGLGAVLTQPTTGSPVVWVGRVAQFTSAVYFLLAVREAAPTGPRAARGPGGLGASLIQSALVYRPMVESLAEVLISLNRSGAALYWNAMAERVFGMATVDIVGRPVAELIAAPGRVEAVATAFDEAIAEAHRGTASVREVDVVDARGRPFPAEIVMHAPDGASGVHVCLLRDITERKQAEAAILELNDSLEARVEERTARLEAANLDLETFSYSVSHDLRAPLRAITGFAEILDRRYRSRLDAKGAHYLDQIIDGGAHMSVLINDLLDYSRLGRLLVRREAVALDPILERLREVFSERVAAGGSIEVVVPLASPMADPTLLHEIVANLLDNALTYARPGVPARARISAIRDDGRVTVAVADNGIGIAPEHRDRIFDVFVRLHRADEYPGTGIGLATVRKAARLMGTDVTVESVPGVGSTFSVVLEAAATDGQAL